MHLYSHKNTPVYHSSASQVNPSLGRCSKAFRKPLNFPYRGHSLRQCRKDLLDISLRGDSGPHTPKPPWMRSLSQMKTRGEQEGERQSLYIMCLLAPPKHLSESFLRRKLSIYVKNVLSYKLLRCLWVLQKSQQVATSMRNSVEWANLEFSLS